MKGFDSLFSNFAKEYNIHSQTEEEGNRYVLTNPVLEVTVEKKLLATPRFDDDTQQVSKFANACIVMLDFFEQDKLFNEKESLVANKNPISFCYEVTDGSNEVQPMFESRYTYGMDNVKVLSVEYINKWREAYLRWYFDAIIASYDGFFTLETFKINTKVAPIEIVEVFDVILRRIESLKYKFNDEAPDYEKPEDVIELFSELVKDIEEKWDDQFDPISTEPPQVNAFTQDILCAWRLFCVYSNYFWLRATEKEPEEIEREKVNEFVTLVKAPFTMESDELFGRDPTTLENLEFSKKSQYLVRGAFLSLVTFQRHFHTHAQIHIASVQMETEATLKSLRGLHERFRFKEFPFDLLENVKLIYTVDKDIKLTPGGKRGVVGSTQNYMFDMLIRFCDQDRSLIMYNLFDRPPRPLDALAMLNESATQYWGTLMELNPNQCIHNILVTPKGIGKKTTGDTRKLVDFVVGQKLQSHLLEKVPNFKCTGFFNHWDTLVTEKIDRLVTIDDNFAIIRWGKIYIILDKANKTYIRTEEYSHAITCTFLLMINTRAKEIIQQVNQAPPHIRSYVLNRQGILKVAEDTMKATLISQDIKTLQKIIAIYKDLIAPPQEKK